jgi:cytochrome c peroxidase
MDLSIDEAARRVNLSVPKLSNALASYVRSILAGNSLADRSAAGDDRLFTADQAAGSVLFHTRGRCDLCHTGDNFTDERPHNTGTSWKNDKFDDQGYFAETRREGHQGAFKTPTLRHVAQRAPYMHDGSISTLEEVIEFYQRGGNRNPFIDSRMAPLNLTTDEKRQLVAYLKALTGDIFEGGKVMSSGATQPSSLIPAFGVAQPSQSASRH